MKKAMKPAKTKETPSQKADRIYAEQHPEKPTPSPAERCATCGKPLEIGDGEHYCFACEPPQPEAASEMLTPCPVYPCPCACHRQGPHVPTDECDEAASEVLTEGRFRSLADCATGYLVRDDTTLDQMAQTEIYFKKLL